MKPTLDDLHDAYSRYATELTKSSAQLTLDNLPAWFAAEHTPVAVTGQAAIPQAIAVIDSRFYSNSQDPLDTKTGSGVLLCSDKTFALLSATEHARKTFQDSLQSLVSVPEYSKRRRHQELSSVLKELGLARLCLKNVFRKLRLYDSVPRKIGFTLSSVRSVVKVEWPDAHALIMTTLKDKEQEAALSNLTKIRPDPVALVRRLQPHYRANLVFDNTGSDVRVMEVASLPFLCLASNRDCLPELPRQLPLPSEIKQQRNADRVLSKLPLVEPLGIFAYESR